MFTLQDRWGNGGWWNLGLGGGGGAPAVLLFQEPLIIDQIYLYQKVNLPTKAVNLSVIRSRNWAADLGLISGGGTTAVLLFEEPLLLVGVRAQRNQLLPAFLESQLHC